MPWDAGSLKPAAVAFILRQLVLFDLRTVVECGAGLSTVFLASALRVTGGRLISIEHDAAWVERVERLLAFEGLSDRVELVHAPLAPGEAGKPAWYSRGAVQGALAAPIDLLLVDGPPAQEPGLGLARLPAAGCFRPALHERSLVVLDDVHRPGEAEIVDRWRAGHGLVLATFGRLRVAAGRLGRVGPIHS